METIFGGLRKFELKNLISTGTLAVLGFLCIAMIIFVPKTICNGYEEDEDNLN